jgi:hypothetical protein
MLPLEFRVLSKQIFIWLHNYTIKNEIEIKREHLIVYRISLETFLTNSTDRISIE